MRLLYDTVHTAWSVVCRDCAGRYVRILGNMVHAIQIKTKLCQLVEVMMERRDDLSFCQEMKFRSEIEWSGYLFNHCSDRTDLICVCVCAY